MQKSKEEVAGLDSINTNYLDRHKKFRIDSKKLAALFLVFAIAVAVIVFWWLKLVGITATADALCGMDEHTHGEACYTSALVCGLEEGIPLISEERISGSVTDGDAAPDAAVHTHTDDCYEKTLVCSAVEHTHTSECFPDKTADIETVSDWLATIDDIEITNNIPENLIAVAISQMGYTESEKNFAFDADGNRNGYTRYGEWYGNPYGKWNAMFVSFCLHYSNINNVSDLKRAGAEAMRLAWQDKYAYAAADAYTPQRGDVVFYDTDGDSVADTVGIILSVSDNSLLIIAGDSHDRVETKTITAADNIIGYGQTGKLQFAKDTEYGKSGADSLITDGDATAGVVYSVQSNPPMLMMSTGEPNIEYRTDLTDFLVDVTFSTQEHEPITDGSTVYIGQTYIITMEFKEQNTGDQWLQFGHNDEHFLTYQIPANFHCEPFTEWHPITAITENGTIEDVGEYFIDENGYLLVTFYDGDDGLCFGHRYSNVDFIIEFNASVGESMSGGTNEVVFNDQIRIELNVDSSAGVDITKTHGNYDPDDHTMEYTVRVEATHGLVKDFTLEDYTWHTHQMLRDTIVVTDLNGNPLDPQPTVGDSFTPNYSGFSLVGFPDFSAGNGYLITYKTKIDDDKLSNDTVSLGNGVYGEGHDSGGNTVGNYKENWVTVELEKMAKNGKQTVLKDANGKNISVIEWEVAIRKNNSNLQGTVVIDTLGEGLQYYTEQPILIKHYDEWGNALTDTYLSWDQVTINGNSMEFALPEGYMFDIFYYTTYDLPAEGEQRQYNNSISATINGKLETAGGEADVVGFVPRVQKNAYGNDGEYVYFTIEADVPGVISNWGGFYLSDAASLWKQTTGEFLYSENSPQDVVITAYTESGRTIEFTPYVEGGPIENTYILLSPGLYDTQHTFNIFFNTSTADQELSKWCLDEDARLVISYKIPFDSKTGNEWSGSLTGENELVDTLLDGFTLNNSATLNYTSVIAQEALAPYQYSPKIFKKSAVNEDGTIDYTVIFYNTIPGTNGNEGYLASADIAYFTDTFDEKLEYVPGSLSLMCYDPWNANNWLNCYTYNGTVSGNSINVASTELVFDKCNPDSGWGVEWLATLDTYQKYCNNMGGGNHAFTYKLKLKDEYLNSVEDNKYVLDNTAELTWNGDNTSGPATDTVEIKTGLLDKQVVQKGNKLEFDIHINRNALDILPGTDKITIEDTMTPLLSVYWDTIKLIYEDENGNWIDFDSADSDYNYTVTYDQNANRLTFTIPDELHIRIDYTTLITESGSVSVNNAVRIDGKAQITDIIDAVFKIEEHSGGASGSIHDITLLKQDGDTGVPLPDVSFHLYGTVKVPGMIIPDTATQSITTDSGKTLYYIGSYTTGADGTVVIETQYLTLGGPYALVEDAAPEGYQILSKPVYFYFYEPDPDGIIQTVTTIIAVENYTYGFVLPETGGTGTLYVTIIGFALTATPVLYSIIRRKRERRFGKISASQ
ncbi:MAG: LPXTG cell wall anchor domain-containing protein [Ruminococcaceae bacterium]|nr:LPXTG cell wall anchor domain-containing protein [Oscillospiraceae bacterium]